jgi:hypothetical protein
MTVITVIMIKWFDSYLVIDKDVSAFQILLGLMLVCIGIMISTVNLTNKGLSSDNTRPWKIFNWVSTLTILVAGVFFLSDFKSRPWIYRENSGELISKEVGNLIVIVRNNNVFYVKKDSMKCTILNPLKSYESYKIDIFGKRSPSSFCVKSDLMKNYVYPSTNINN